MNFNDLMQKMRELDQPVVQAEACGDPMPPMPPMSSPMNTKPDTPPPSLSINLNAQGMDNIESIMKLMTKVNPDMINQPPSMPMSMPISISKPSPMSMGPLGNLDAGPLKMLPDMDSDNDDMPGGKMDLPPDHDKDHAMVKALDKDDDGDHDMDDHDIEKKDKEEAFGNSVDGSEPEYADISASIPDGNDMHKPKKSFSGKPYRGDNPMAAGAYESKDQLRASIREELLQRLAEAKGAK
jgi:hypothetical protein